MIQVLRAAGPHGQTVSNICFPRQGQVSLKGEDVMSGFCLWQLLDPYYSIDSL